MSFLVEAFEWIINTVTMVIDFFISFVDSLTLLLKYLGVVANICYACVASLPSWLQTFALITVAVCILCMVLGRNSGGKNNA